MEGYLQRHLWGARSRSLTDYRAYLWQLTQDQLVSVLSAASLVVDNEVQVYRIIKDWFHHHFPLAQVETIPANLFACIRFAAMSRSDILDLLAFEPALRGSQHVMDQLTGRLLQPNRGLDPARPTVRNLVWDVRPSSSTSTKVGHSLRSLSGPERSGEWPNICTLLDSSYELFTTDPAHVEAMACPERD